MISLAAVGSPSAAGGYYAADNYYTANEAREASAWAGKAAETLGLSGAVEEKAFTAILEGKLPNGAVIAAPNGAHRPGLDLTFSASKSVSLLAMLGGDQRLVEAVRDSALATLAWAETNVIEARVWDAGEGRQVAERTGNLLAATFLHDVNRNNEPQLHVHAVVANATLASDGKWHAVHNDAIYRAQHVLSAVHNAELRARVEALGYDTTAARNPIDGAFEIAGVERRVIEAFSTRTAEIRAALAAQDRSSPRERELAALATRKGKDGEIDPAERMAEWRATAASIGFDPAAPVAAAIERSERGTTIWSQVASGIRGIGASGLAIAARMGLTPRDGDPLVPERLGTLAPPAFAAAQAVASAARELGEREAAFSRHDLLRTSLERLGPFGVAEIEARIDALTAKGALIAGERMMTTEGALALEARVIALAEAGRGAAPAIVAEGAVGARLQETARELGLRRLNPGQEQAGAAILTGNERVQLVQGSAGVGKSAALTPVAAIAQAEGRNVHALAHVGRIAREFGAKTGSPASTVDGFLGRYRRVMAGTASPERMDKARAELAGAVILVDEASQIGTERLARLINLANTMDVARLVLAGDVRQLPAIEAGRPFAELQREGLPTAIIAENLRARSEQMQALGRELDAGDMAGAFAVLASDTIEVAPGDVVATAAALWADQSAEARAGTVLLAAGRATRSAGNEAAQAALVARGELGVERLALQVLDRVTITAEGARQLKGYREDRIVVFGTDLPKQGFVRGERGRVLDVADGKVELVMADGELRRLDPARLRRNLRSGAVEIFEEKAIALHSGDRIRWTASDRPRGLDNGEIAHVTAIDRGTITVMGSDGREHVLPPGDPQRERLDLAYAINVHVAQGITAECGIIMMSEREKQLNTAKSFLVAVTRIADQATLVVDNAARIERQVLANPGEKSSAQEVLREGAPAAPMVTSAQPAPAVAPPLPPVPEILIERSYDFEID